MNESEPASKKPKYMSPDDKVRDYKRDFARYLHPHITSFMASKESILEEISQFDRSLRNIDANIINRLQHNVRIDREVKLKIFHAGNQLLPTTSLFIKQISIVRDFGIFYKDKIEPLIKAILNIMSDIKFCIAKIREIRGHLAENDVGKINEALDSLKKIYLDYSDSAIPFEKELLKLADVYKINDNFRVEMERAIVERPELIEWVKPWLDENDETPFDTAISNLTSSGRVLTGYQH